MKKILYDNGDLKRVAKPKSTLIALAEKRKIYRVSILPKKKKKTGKIQITPLGGV